MSITHVTVLGTGVLGSQIAFQTAFHGLEVVAYDINQEVLDAAKQRFEGLAAVYEQEQVAGGTGTARDALARISYSDDLESAVEKAELVIEAIPELLDLKRETYERLGKAAPESAIFATNSSTLLPSDMMESTGRPDRFLALHFANQIWVHNTAEIMGTDKTDPQVYAAVVEFATSIAMVPIELKKEKAGYVLNSLLVPFLQAAAALYVDGVAEPETIDTTWKIGTGAPAGPFEIYDVVGLTTAYNIAAAGDSTQQRFAALIKERFIDQGKLGVATGEGFYTYPR